MANEVKFDKEKFARIRDLLDSYKYECENNIFHMNDDEERQARKDSKDCLSLIYYLEQFELTFVDKDE